MVICTEATEATRPGSSQVLPSDRRAQTLQTYFMLNCIPSGKQNNNVANGHKPSALKSSSTSASHSHSVSPPQTKPSGAIIADQTACCNHRTSQSQCSFPGTECLPGLATQTGSIVGVVIMPAPLVAVVVALTPSPAYAGEESEPVL